MTAPDRRAVTPDELAALERSLLIETYADGVYWEPEDAEASWNDGGRHATEPGS